MSSLILPGHPEFELTLSLARPSNWLSVAQKHGNFCFVADCETGLLRAASPLETTEYLLGGEYQLRLNRIGEPEHHAY